MTTLLILGTTAVLSGTIAWIVNKFKCSSRKNEVSKSIDKAIFVFVNINDDVELISSDLKPLEIKQAYWGSKDLTCYFQEKVKNKSKYTFTLTKEYALNEQIFPKPDHINTIEDPLVIYYA